MIKQFDFLSSDNFLNSYWQKNFFLFKNKMSQIPFSRFDLDQLIKTQTLALTDLNLFNEGKKLTTKSFIKKSNHVRDQLLGEVFDPVKVANAIKNINASVRITAADRFNRTLFQLKEEFTKETQHYCTVNLYYTPPSGNCFARHLDPYDIFILQTQGRKKWYLGSIDEIDEKKGLRNYKSDNEITLEAGDVLYLPKNTAHYASCETDSDSLHITIGLHRPTYFAILEHAIRKLQGSYNQEIAMLNGSFRYDPSVVRNELKKMQISLHQCLSLNNSIDDYYASFLELRDESEGSFSIYKDQNEN